MTEPFICAMPWVYEPYARTSIDSNRMAEAGRFMPIDNSIINKGIMRAQNMVLDERRPDEWFIIMSAALEFGPPGGLDFIEHLTTHADHGVITAADTYGWHLVAFRPDVAAAMGRFDENLTPYGWDDIDLSIRIHKLMPDLVWGGFPVDVTDRGMAHSLKIAGVYSPTTHLDYMVHKWGYVAGQPFDFYLDHPFGTLENHVNFWPTRNDAAWNQPAPGYWRS